MIGGSSAAARRSKLGSPSGRWSFNYETRQFLAPGYQGEDRSQEFGPLGLDLTTDGSRDVLYLFLPPYQDLIDQVAQQYPGGTTTESRDDDGQVLFRAYRLPGPSATAPAGASAR